MGARRVYHSSTAVSTAGFSPCAANQPTIISRSLQATASAHTEPRRVSERRGCDRFASSPDLRFCGDVSLCRAVNATDPARHSGVPLAYTSRLRLDCADSGIWGLSPKEPRRVSERRGCDQLASSPDLRFCSDVSLCRTVNASDPARHSGVPLAYTSRLRLDCALSRLRG